MKKSFLAFFIITALIISGLGFSSVASASAPKGITYYTTQGTHLYKDKKGSKVVRTLPLNTKLYLGHKPAKGFYRINYKKTSGYINVRDLSQLRFASFNDFKGTWYASGHKTLYIDSNVPVVSKNGKTIGINMIEYNVADAAVAYVNASQATIKGNKLIMKNAALVSDGNYDQGKVNQVLTLSNSGKKLSVTDPKNGYINSFHGSFAK
ncbi:MAG: hypothetical protein ABF651_11185 [Sporolactobacillus sp.]